MTNLYKCRSVICAAAGLLASGVLVNTGSAAHSWENYHWARTTPTFTLQLGNNLSGHWRSYLYDASSDWNSPELFGANSTPVLTAVVAGQAKKKECSMVAGTAQVCDGDYGNNGWLGLATIEIIDGDHIIQGSAKLNNTYFNTSTYNNPNQRIHVMCQEIAHTFGLGHQSEDGSSQNSCMDYFSHIGANATNPVSTRPNQHDFEHLAAMYAHLDSTTTLSSGSVKSKLRDKVGRTDDPNSWGLLKRQSRNGRKSTYEAHNRDGSKTVTHVYWTEEAAAGCPSCDHRYGGGH